MWIKCQHATVGARIWYTTVYELRRINDDVLEYMNDVHEGCEIAIQTMLHAIVQEYHMTSRLARTTCGNNFGNMDMPQNVQPQKI
mmetsp:Transcript_53877/g.174048  ORF Transcript_53877/g.174048 Transcript_53877/m.174048 type:complete len:85 (+) Transcript_53877:23-277(+)